MIKPLVLSTALATSLLLLACSEPQPAPNAPPPPPLATAPVQTNTSLALLPSGYKKVAAPQQAEVYFINLKNGDVLANPVRVQFGLRGMGIAPAGTEKEGTGHHHLLVNVTQVDINNPLPTDDKHRHFGLGQTEVTLTLPPGQHTLQLLLGDHNHIPHHPPVLSERITVTVR